SKSKCSITNSMIMSLFFFSSRRRHTRSKRDWSSDVCSSDLAHEPGAQGPGDREPGGPFRALPAAPSALRARGTADGAGAVEQQRPRRLDPPLRPQHGRARDGTAAPVPRRHGRRRQPGTRVGSGVTIGLFALFALALLVLALAGRRLVRWSTPVLVRAPRLASTLLLGTLAVWSVAAVVLSVALAGLAQGPQLLVGPAGDVCQRCLSAASPF